MKLTSIAAARRLAALAMILGAIVATSFGEARAAARCTGAQKDAANRALALGPAEAGKALKAVLPWGAPRSRQPNAVGELLVQPHFATGYDHELLGPLWSADVVGDKPTGVARVDCFRADPRLSPQTASSPSDYVEPIFDQGHMTPNGDMAFDTTAILNTFVMSNMSPQFCQFNRGVWQILETLTRGWGRTRGRLYVLSGAIFDRDGDGQRDPNSGAVRMRSRDGRVRVAVPSAYYKVLAHVGEDGRLETLTVVLPHDQTDLNGTVALAYLDAHVSRLATVEALTGMKLFPRLRHRPKEATRLWDVAGLRFNSLVNAKCRLTGSAWILASRPPVYALP